VREVARWIGERGGLAEMAAMADRKSGAIYEAIARSGAFYTCPVEPAARSRMNVVFRLPTPELEGAFVKAAEAEGMVGLKGHRVVGGIRASLYNAVEESWVEALASFMDAFRARHGH
jgi:phosphoserine aminotransferase